MSILDSLVLILKVNYLKGYHLIFSKSKAFKVPLQDLHQSKHNSGAMIPIKCCNNAHYILK